MPQRLGKCLVVLVLVVSTGGHWFALQSGAWFTMAVKFARTDPLDVALKKTFDGKHPCSLCKSVEEGRKSEQKQSTLKFVNKLDFCFARESVTFPEPPAQMHHTVFALSQSSRSEAPPTPPPRAA